MTTALYRRYRPETFAEVVGQDHVTAPLRQALRSGQTNHAYLFSGPRGCGKTTSARILARCLNCAEGPTDTPCGVCPSCVELARGGPGSLDVVEIDAASHGGVDDARDLRERATFAPARDRYKVFILDEAHMVSPQGFNALLKIVEEPPEHVKFIFATTEPDKVIGTIRSRTHHYPFRLVPPDVMVGYLDQLCTTEGVTVGSGVLPLVVRAGGGSVRDSLSVLDQLIAGSGPDGLVYEDAVALLGYTHASLLDDLVEAIAARDGASAFRVVERVISTGHEPRRFVEDLLERLRDLIVLAASGEAAAAVLRDVPGDQMARMQQQAAHLGAAELSRSADLVNAALSEMTGATSPRLHLELLMARLLLPALDDSAAGIGARVDRLEREGVRVAGAGAPAVAPAAPAAASAFAPSTPVERVAVVTPPPAPAPEVRAAEETLRAAEPEVPEVAAPAADADATSPDGAHLPAAGTVDAAPAVAEPDAAPAERATAEPVAAEPAAPAEPAAAGHAPVPHDVPTAEPVAPAERPAGAPGGGDTEMLRRRWPEVLETLGRLKKTTWVLISQNAQVVELDATTLKLGFGAPGLASAFRAGSHADLVQQAVRETLGFTVKVEPVLAGAPGPAAGRPAGGPAAPTTPGRTATPSAAEAAASWDAPAARPAPVPSPVESPRTPHGGAAGGAGGVDAPADEEPDAADPWASATTEPRGAAAADGSARPDADTRPDAAARPDGSARHDAAARPADGRPGGADAGADAAPGATPAAGRTTAAAPAVSADGWPEVAPIPGSRATGDEPGRQSDDAAAAQEDDGPARTGAGASSGGPSPVDRGAADARPGGPDADDRATDPRAVEDRGADPRPGDVDDRPTGAPAGDRPAGPDQPAGSHQRAGSDQLAGPGRSGASAGPSDGSGPSDRSVASDRPATPDAPSDAPAAPGRADRASGSAASGRPAARPAPTDPGAPPPWDPHPDDPGAPEPPDDDWARDLPPDPGPDPFATGAPAPARPAPTAPSAQPSGADRVRAAARAAAAGGATAAAAAPRVSWADDEPSMDDPDIGSSGLSGIPLLAQALSATVIEEIVDEGY
ncbi:DNA polymerase III subunit gamma and tau [Cellulomonas pakistanensis]|uniref:DNA-directed DNA polymerase n=1 Tax=Cellulomonas pakistanensis TaxID=992287 RepID=A0A919PAA5_9CELL|nr:DNA polymerase III subunit gamma and tau [Cellulomonas pakistanensis]GIG37319.1 hypothetical protein Cpa01nite_27000 [Cellulomonas pakistanensis]